MSRRNSIGLAVAVVTTLACPQPPDPLGPEGKYSRIALVTFDTLNVDFVGVHNSRVDFTPNLDAFAASGLVFDHAYTQVPLTLPSHASLLSGRRPEDINVLVNGDSVPDSLEMLPEVLSAAGLHTAAFVSLGVLHHSYNLSQGFSTYDDDFQGEKRRWYRTADEVFAASSEWIEAHAAQPFFVWIHFSDPHEPYVQKQPTPDVQLSLDGVILGRWNLTTKEIFTVEVTLPPSRHHLTWTSLRSPRTDDQKNTALILSLHQRESLQPFLNFELEDFPDFVDLKEPWTLDLTNPTKDPISVQLVFDGATKAPPASEVLEQYRLEVAYADHYFGRLQELFDDLGLQDNTLWIVVSDHGEGLFRHGIRAHATSVYEDQLRILWMMKGDGIPQGERIKDHPVLIEDIAPTVLDLVELLSPTSLTGLSQTSCWTEVGCKIRRQWYAFGAKSHPQKITAVAGYQWPFKLLYRPRQRRKSGLYNLLDDPREETDLRRLVRQTGTVGPVDLQDFELELKGVRSRLQEQISASDHSHLSPDQLHALRALGYLGD